MKDHGYSGQLAAGAIAAGGTLGILIPPSTILVIYGLVTETSIGKLFAAGMLPGLLAVFMMCLTIAFITWRDPSSGPAAERSSWAERFDAMKDVWAVAVLFVIVMGGIYGGVFTTTEGAGIGAFGAFIIALLRRSLNFSVTLDILIESARTTGMLFMILVGALVFANFVNFTTLPSDLKSLVSTHNISPVAVMIAICAIYVILGAAMEELSMVLLTLPVFFPLVVSLGFDPVWFGIVIVLVVMIGLISPPVGMNMFVVRNMLPELSTATIFKGVMPFVYTLVVVLALLVAFPQIALFLPQALKL
jgi:tripartite ATP-independent transporter DctM subunit